MCVCPLCVCKRALPLPACQRRAAPSGRERVGAGPSGGARAGLWAGSQRPLWAAGGAVPSPGAAAAGGTGNSAQPGVRLLGGAGCPPLIQPESQQHPPECASSFDYAPESDNSH